MPTYSRGDVIVVLYPFTDGSGVVLRPAIVVSSDEHNAKSLDVVLLAQITSNITSPLNVGDFLIEDWGASDAHLDKPSKARMGKLLTVAKTEINRIIGHLSNRDLQAVDANLKFVLGL